MESALLNNYVSLSPLMLCLSTLNACLNLVFLLRLPALR